MDTSIHDHPVLFSFRCMYIYREREESSRNAFEGSFDTIVSQNGRMIVWINIKGNDCCTHLRGHSEDWLKISTQADNVYLKKYDYILERLVFDVSFNDQPVNWIKIWQWIFLSKISFFENATAKFNQFKNLGPRVLCYAPFIHCIGKCTRDRLPGTGSDGSVRLW